MTRKQKRELRKIIASAVFFIASFFVEEIKISNISLSVIFSLVAFIVCGWQSVVRAIKNIVRLNPLDEHLLMSAASIGAFLIGEPMEGAAVMLFYQIGELFQSIAVSKSRKSIAALADIVPEYAVVLRDGKYISVEPSEVLVGDKILIKPGERVPVDAQVVEGTSDIDTKAITGEGLPVSVEVGSIITSGSVNISGVIYATALSTYKNSTVSKILELTENVSSRKSNYESFIHRFALSYTPIVVIGAVLFAIVPSIFFGNAIEWVRRALTFLVISCPCALVISVPLSFFAGLGRASKNGVLIKGSNFLEALSQSDTAIFDKTGTLTSGGFFVTEINPNGIDKNELLSVAASVEQYSNHPIADAIKSEHEGEFIDIDEVKELAGLGIYAKCDMGELLVGNKRLMEAYNIEFSESKASGTVVYVANNKTFLGTLIVSDKVKENAAIAINSLRKTGIKKVVILTGDKKEAALEVSGLVLADEIKYELLPQEKMSAVEEIMKTSKGVIFVGDGINDAPVMALADVSISMGQIGQDAAIEASDIVLTDDNLEKIPFSISLAKNTVNIARANIVFCIGIKVLVLILGAFGVTNIWAAVFADVGVCILAILNSMRLFSKKIAIIGR